MNNLFSIFDPTTDFLNLSSSLNWSARITCLMMFVPAFWLSLSKPLKLVTICLKTLEKEIAVNFYPIVTPGLSHLIVSIFFMVRINNYLGLTSYTFTRTSHLTFTVALALLVWTRIIMLRLIKDISHSLAHLVPLGTPYALIPLIVIIELISNLIRPLTLSVRLAANIVAGHLLLTLISGALVGNSAPVLLLGGSGLVLLMALENGVALIQGYVFRMLPSLYLAEVNSPSLNYLNNFWQPFTQCWK